MYRKPSACSDANELISIFEPLLQKITQDMDTSFTAKFKDMTYDAAIELYKKVYVKNEKEFIQLVMVQGINNVTEVRFVTYDKWMEYLKKKYSISCLFIC